jgi:hypothetical protein
VRDVYLHSDAENDLEELWKSQPDGAALVQALLEELASDQVQFDHLTDDGYGKSDASARFNITKWNTQWYGKRRNLWRIRFYALDQLGLAYRIVYAFVPREIDCCVLAVAHRDFNYEPSHEITQRILRAYDEVLEDW